MTTSRKVAQDVADWIGGPKWVEWEIKDMEVAIQTAIDKETYKWKWFCASAIIVGLIIGKCI